MRFFVLSIVMLCKSLDSITHFNRRQKNTTSHGFYIYNNTEFELLFYFLRIFCVDHNFDV